MSDRLSYYGRGECVDIIMRPGNGLHSLFFSMVFKFLIWNLIKQQCNPIFSGNPSVFRRRAIMSIHRFIILVGVSKSCRLTMLWLILFQLYIYQVFSYIISSISQPLLPSLGHVRVRYSKSSFFRGLKKSVTFCYLSTVPL